MAFLDFGWERTDGTACSLVACCLRNRTAGDATGRERNRHPVKTIVVVYTTRYRKGGRLFPVVAHTLAQERRDQGFDGEAVCEAVESKRDLLRIFADVAARGHEISEFHFVGHSGMYGPMFGTVAFPEQFSPYEWETLSIPFAAGASAYFHCCRSARWFAPYFARTFGVRAYGFFWYTTFSTSRTRYHSADDASTAPPLYTIGCKGRKSHGLVASAIKRAGLMPAERMQSFDPQPPAGDTTYEHVASLYDDVFADIQVRDDEWQWISRHLPARKNIRVLDIGCGNGALLAALSDRIGSAAGVDESAAMLERARNRTSSRANLEFKTVAGPLLPFSDGEFDVVISLMSFRYLDWDPLMREVKRVTKGGGILLVVDMVTDPVKSREYPRLVADKIRTTLRRKRRSDFNRNLKRLVEHPDWKTMVTYNPIRSEHEMKWYLESRFPGHTMEILNLGWHARMVAFDSGPVERGLDSELSYP
jgi:ubiquinone/menaquinone biosynthesis C-methylase UbiE